MSSSSGPELRYLSFVLGLTATIERYGHRFWTMGLGSSTTLGRVDANGGEDALVPADGVVDELVAWGDVCRRWRRAKLVIGLDAVGAFPGVVRHRSVARTEHLHEIG